MLILVLKRITLSLILLVAYRSNDLSRIKGPKLERKKSSKNRKKVKERNFFSPYLRNYIIGNILFFYDYKTKVAKLGAIYEILYSEADEAIRRESLNFIFANITGNIFKDSIGYALPAPCQQTTPSLQPSLNVK